MIYRSPHPEVDIPDVRLDQHVLEDFDRNPDRAALIDGTSGRTVTYARLRADIARTAAGLAARGFGRGDVFAICLPNVPEYATALLAVSRLGGAVTTINPLCTAAEMASQLAQTGARFLLTVDALAGRAAEAARGSAVEELFVLGEAAGTTAFGQLLTATGEAPEAVADARSDVVALPYSSGTSGLPKGVMLTHRNLVAQLCQASVHLPRGDSEVAIAVLPFFHIYGMALLLLHGLCRGITLVCLPRFDFEQFLELVQRYRVTQAALVPPIVLGLAKHPAVDRYDLSSLRRITCGAAPLGLAVEQAVAGRLGCAVAQGYGMTELSGAALSHSDPEGRGVPGTVGRCWPGMEARVVDLDSGADLGPGYDGELWLRGPTVMRGYFGRPDATADVLTPDGWLRTGDVARVDADGNFAIVDRVKELIKHNAYQIAPAELEAVLLRHPAVADAAVIPSPDEDSGEVPKAFVVLRAPVPPAELLEFVAGQVAPYKKIRRIALVESIPKSPSGKILRRLLIEQERAAAT